MAVSFDTTINYCYDWGPCLGHYSIMRNSAELTFSNTFKYWLVSAQLSFMVEN